MDHPEANEFWGKEDNVTVCKILQAKGHSMNHVLGHCCVHGSVKIFSHLMETTSLNPSYVSYWGSEYNSVAVCVWHSQPEVLKVLLKDPRACLRIRGLLYGTVLSDAVGSRSFRVNPHGAHAANTSEPSRQVEVIRLLLEDGRIVPTEEEFYHCSEIPEIMSLLLADTRLDPTVRNNMPLEQSIRRKSLPLVRVLLADERVSKLVDQRTLDLARQWGTEEIVSLVSSVLSDKEN